MRDMNKFDNREKDGKIELTLHCKVATHTVSTLTANVDALLKVKRNEY